MAANASIDDPSRMEGLRRGRLCNARLIQPLNQGDICDGLSGLYAIVNGFRLATARKRQLSTFEVEALFLAGLRFIELRQSLARCSATGMRHETWRRLADALKSYTETRLGVRLFLDQPFRHGHTMDAAEAFHFLERMVHAQKVTMMLRRGGYYSIVSGFIAQSLILFDSGGGRWIPRHCCGLLAAMPRARHGLCPRSFITVCV